MWMINFFLYIVFLFLDISKYLFSFSDSLILNSATIFSKKNNFAFDKENTKNLIWRLLLWKNQNVNLHNFELQIIINSVRIEYKNWIKDHNIINEKWNKNTI